MAIYFYKEFGTLGYLANYSEHGFFKDGIYYKTVEHYYQSNKFLDESLKLKVISAKTPKEASMIGRDRSNKLRENWRNIKNDIMLEGVLLKFRQNNDILLKLISTGNDEIFENTIDEYYWGCGKDKTGENNFGKILMEARDILKKEYINNMILKLKQEKSVYIIGHNNIDFDSYFSTYLLTKILKKFEINATFSIMDYYRYQSDSIDAINDYKEIEPVILDSIEHKFILVDHNDTLQSINNNNNNNILFSIDHHIDSKKVENCISTEFTSTLLTIYYLFKDIYKFNDKEKQLIALSVVFDSEFLTSTRFRDEDKKIFNELNVKFDINLLKNKYFKTTDFALNIIDNIKNNYKLYNIDNKLINRVCFKTYNKDREFLNKYLEEINKLYQNNLLIWNEYDTLKTLVYYNSLLVNEYDYILSSSVLIIKDLIDKKIIK